MHATRTAAALGLVLVLSAPVGCAISPLPEPPSLDSGQITVELISTNPDGTEVDSAIVQGGAGAAVPGGATIRVVNLDRNEEAREAVSEEDGSFTIVLGAAPGEELRLRAYAEELSSRPLDIVIPEESGPPAPPTRPLDDCFVVRAPSEVRFGSVAVGDIAVEVIVIENECEQPAEIAGLWLRVGSNPAPDCDLDYQQCIEGYPPDDDPSRCFDELTTCQESCRTRYEQCLGEDMPDACVVELTSCEEGCNDTHRTCLEPYCDDILVGCTEVPYAEPQGFSVLHGTLPMIVPSGSSRSVVVTFAPLVPGPAEDALLIEVVSPESERRPITLTGTGVSG